MYALRAHTRHILAYRQTVAATQSTGRNQGRPTKTTLALRCRFSGHRSGPRTILDKLHNFFCDFNQWSKRLEEATKAAEADKKRLMESNNVNCLKSQYILLTLLLIDAVLCYLLLLPCSTLLCLLLRSLNNATFHGNSAS